MPLRALIYAQQSGFCPSVVDVEMRRPARQPTRLPLTNRKVAGVSTQHNSLIATERLF
jgi:hypothetical protein